MTKIHISAGLEPHYKNCYTTLCGQFVDRYFTKPELMDTVECKTCIKIWQNREASGELVIRR